MKYLLVLIPFSFIISAYTSYQDQMEILYNKNFNCNICHNVKSLNKYGEDFKFNLENNIIKTFIKIEKLDSDNDSFNNINEINSDKNPGDSFNFPKENNLKSSH